jgi:D-alanyl-D-alanine carboxypeptidase/D-alanyl-D-alanine-endopeptidase (penicillin-binding protein 4)
MPARLVSLLFALVLLARPLAAEPEPELQRKADALASWAGERKGRAGIVFVEVPTGRVLASANPELALNPASNAKIFTAATALARLGPGYRFTTSVHGRIEGGVAAELVLRGHGDPSLRSADLAALARELAALGLRKVAGDLLVDQSRFDDRFVPPAFDQQPNEWAAFRAPVSAVAVDRNAVTIHVLAGKAGEPARAWAEPPGAVELDNRALTGPRGAGRKLELTLRAKEGKLVAVLGGKLAEGLPRVELQRRVDDPRLLAGRVLAHFLRREGVELGGNVASGGSGEREVLVTHVSQPLSSLLHELGKRSDNYYAEMILKAIGAESATGPATSAAGAGAVGDWLRAAGALEPSTRIVNGSGLFDANRASASTLARALAAGYRDPSIASELVAQLAIGGVDGTLRSRFQRQASSRAVRAKTGTLARVVALSGYVLSPSRAPIAFAMVVEAKAADQPGARRRMDELVERALLP